MRIAIMQPTYLPWPGYFQLIAQSEYFVFLDDVQFDKRSWQQRNKILVGKESKFLTVPVFSKNRFHQKLNQTEIDHTQGWARKHIQTINHSYSKSSNFNQIFPRIKKHLLCDYKYLSELNTSIIREISSLLNLPCKFVKSSSLQIHGKKQDRLVNICNELNAHEYLSPPGSISYLNNTKVFTKNGILLKFIKYRNFSQLYSQRTESGENLSILDILFYDIMKLQSFFM